MRPRFFLSLPLVLALAGASLGQCPPLPPKYGPRDVVPAGGTGGGGQPAASPTTPSPGVPGPGGPSTPGPGGPSTGGPHEKGPATGGPGSRGAITPRGIELDLGHRKTSRKRLEIEWDHPVWVTQALLPAGGGQTAAVAEPPDQRGAFRFLAGDDPRPLLVLRECRVCKGSDAALLRADLDNDKTLLLTKWFHCVKLGADVVREDHPLRVVFPGKQPPHLLLATRDGSEIVTFSGAQGQSDLWAGMYKLLRRVYAGDPEARVKEWQRLLARFDHLDTMRGTIEDRIQREHETRGGSTALARSLESDLSSVKRQMDEALAQEQKIRELGFLVER